MTRRTDMAFKDTMDNISKKVGKGKKKGKKGGKNFPQFPKDTGE
jgi:hypothetical protein